MYTSDEIIPHLIDVHCTTMMKQNEVKLFGIAID